MVMVSPSIVPSSTVVSKFSLQRKISRSVTWMPSIGPAMLCVSPIGAHSAPTDNILRPGHIFNIDFGVKVDKYCSDLQRTYYVPRAGETAAPEPVVRGLRTIVESISLAAAALRPGALGHEIDAIARGHIVSAGYGEYPHALGHQPAEPGKLRVPRAGRDDVVERARHVGQVTRLAVAMHRR